MEYTRASFGNEDIWKVYDAIISQVAPSGGATAANQLLEIAALNSILVESEAQTESLATIEGALIADNVPLLSTIISLLEETDGDPISKWLKTINTSIGTGNGSLATIAGKDFATQTTLASVNSKFLDQNGANVFLRAGTNLSLLNYIDQALREIGGNSAFVDLTDGASCLYRLVQRPQNQFCNRELFTGADLAAIKTAMDTYAGTNPTLRLVNTIERTDLAGACEVLAIYSNK